MTSKLQIYFLISLIHFGSGSGQLVVNVQNKGGDVLKETIMSNTTLDTIHLEFQKEDGTMVTQFIDFKNDVQIFKSVVLGEMERGQSQYQVMCYVTKFSKNDFISSDAMSKLRQKNPGAIRKPEEDKGSSVYHMDLFVNVQKAHVITPYIPYLCEDAKDSTYACEADFRYLAKPSGKNSDELLKATNKFPSDRKSRCRELAETSEIKKTESACTCRYEICVGWYPCGLKYCRGKDSAGHVVSYRCGIKTCTKCRLFDYFVHQKQLCIWDESG